MLQKSFDVIHIEKISDRRIKLLIILFFNLFSKIKHYIFTLQFKLINFLENYDNIIKEKNNFYFRTIIKKKKSLLIICNSKETLNLRNKKFLDRDIVVVNDFFLSDLSRSIIPNYYFCLHPFEGDYKFNSAKDKKLYLNRFIKYIIKNKTTKFFFDPSFKLLFGNQKNVYYLNLSSVPLCYFHDINEINIEKKFPSVSNISLACVILGIYLNYKNIKIIGYTLYFFLGNLAGYNLKNHSHAKKKNTI
jgi:hypothetical protein